jgi:cysteine synthase A
MARRRAAEHAALKKDGSVGFFADQFENAANVAAHERGTGPEIVAQTAGVVHVFVAGAGTGGTLSGVARHLRRALSATSPPRIILADPQGSGLYHRVRHGVMFAPTEREGTRRRAQVDSLVEGIGINRVVANFEAGRHLVDDAVRVDDAQACRMAAWLSRREGIFIGSSSAVNCVGAVVAACRFAAEGDTVVTVLCDSGARHLSKFWKRIADDGLDRPDHDHDDLWHALGIDRDALSPGSPAS